MRRPRWAHDPQDPGHQSKLVGALHRAGCLRHVVVGFAHPHHFTVSNGDRILRTDNLRQDIPDWRVEKELCGTHCFAFLRRSEIRNDIAPTHSDLDLAAYERIGLSEMHLARTTLEGAHNKQTKSGEKQWPHLRQCLETNSVPRSLSNVGLHLRMTGCEAHSHHQGYVVAGYSLNSLPITRRSPAQSMSWPRKH